jgi:hypothetical protein
MIKKQKFLVFAIFAYMLLGAVEPARSQQCYCCQVPGPTITYYSCPNIDYKQCQRSDWQNTNNPPSCCNGQIASSCP